jgi:hypothetical protein
MKRKRPKAREDDDELGQDGNFEESLRDLDPEYDASGRHLSKKAKQPGKSFSEPPSEPKKRGRKKKQPVTEDVARDEVIQEPDILAATVPGSVTETQTPGEKPKKKRGRPRKSEVPKNDEIQKDELPTASKRHAAAQSVSLDEISGGDGSTTIEDSLEKPTTKASTEPDNSQLGPMVEKSLARSISPLKETDRNTLLTSQSTVSEPDKSRIKSSTPSQAGKALYRVGLSKKSRIAPLLKIIRK